jgi:hypothetical protein
MWNDIDEYALAGLEILGPAILNGAIGAPVEVGILGEMIEPFARAIEAGSNEMPAVICRLAIGASGSRLLLAGPLANLPEPQFARHAFGSTTVTRFGIDVKIISVACDPDGGGFAGNRKCR